MKNLYPFLGAPLAILTILNFEFIQNPSFLYNSPSSLYFVSLVVIAIPTFIYWLSFGFVNNRLEKINHLILFINNYLFTIIWVLYGTLNKEFKYTVLFFIFSLALFHYINYKTLIHSFDYKKQKIFLFIFIFITTLIPTFFNSYVRFSRPEPLTPFEIRNQQMSCSSFSDCAAFDCAGYNTGKWFCDNNGSPMCRFDTGKCDCYLGCI